MDIVNEIFGEYNDICNRIIELNYKALTIRSSLTSVRAINYEQIRTSNNPSLIAKIQTIDNLEKEIKSLGIKKKNIYDSLIEMISKLSNEKYKCILRCTYLLHMDVNEVLDIIDISANHFYKLKKKALNELYKIYIDSKW